jgi:hypothetical protein
MKKTLLFLLACALLLSGCLAAPEQKLAPTNLPPLNTLQPLPARAEQLAMTPTPAPTNPAEPAGTPTPDPAVAAAQAYADALLAGNFKGAAELLSSYSLMVEEITRTEAAENLQSRMAREKWSEVKILAASPYSPKTALVHVTYQVERKDPKTSKVTQSSVDELWALRLENRKWLVNDNQLIDYHTLNVSEQTVNNLTVKPRRLILYTDRVSLNLLVQNRGNEPIVLGQTNEVMAAFLYGETQVEAEKTRFIFDRLRSYPDVTIDLKQPLSTYPDGIILRQWKNVKVAPWFTFQFNQ